jgi:hypothetical protein
MTAEQTQKWWGSTVPNPKRLGDPDEYVILAAEMPGVRVEKRPWGFTISQPNGRQQEVKE